MSITLEGALVAIATPFQDGAVDYDALRRLIEHLVEEGSDGLVPCGTTGESATLTKDEQEKVIRATIEQVNGRVPVIAGVGTNNTAATVENAKRAKELGADALLVVAPPYNKPNQEGLFRHFWSVAETVALPQVVYNVPGRTSCRVEIGTLARLAAHPHIVAVKDATGDMVFGSQTLEACGDNLTLLSGDDGTTFPLLALGAQGCISVVGNIAPRLMSDLCRACKEARWTDARQLHYKVLPLFRAMFSDSNPIPVKAALSLMGFMKNELRLPLVPMNGAALETLARSLEIAGELK